MYWRVDGTMLALEGQHYVGTRRQAGLYQYWKMDGTM